MESNNILESSLAQYTSNAFTITLSKDLNFFEGISEDGEVPFQVFANNKARFSVFVHEYWHYLVNVSTLARYFDFSLGFHLVTLFSRTLVDHKNGKSNGNSSLNDEEIKFASKLVEFLTHFRGSKKPEFEDKSVLDRNIKSFLIDDFEIYNKEIEIHGDVRQRKFVKLFIQVSTTYGEKKATFNFGAHAIDEGIAHLIESFINDDNSTPEFPYKIIIALSEKIIRQDIPDEDLLVIATLSFLTINPAIAFIELLNTYKNKCLGIINSNDRHILLINEISNHFEKGFTLVKKELKEIRELSKNRGAIQFAMRYVEELISKYLRVRKSHYLFDLEPFIQGEVNIPLLEKNLHLHLPCDVLQINPGGENEISRDSFFTFDDKDYDWNPTKFSGPYFLKMYFAILKYVFSHINEEGFVSSENATCKCPFYTTCDLPSRKKHPELCSSTPWKLYSIQNKLCWFNQGVASLLGEYEYGT